MSPDHLSRLWGLRPKTILHVGAHWAEELEAYEECGWGDDLVVWVEALPEAVAMTRERVSNRGNHIVIEGVAWSSSGETITFHESNNGQSSSVLEFGTHTNHYQDIHFTNEAEMVTLALGEVLDQVQAPTMEFINLDIQGAELEALKGIGDRMGDALAVYSEVNVEELYKGCARLSDLDAWLAVRGFTRVDIEMTPYGWGDALWLRANAVPAVPKLRRLRRLASTRASGFSETIRRRLHR